MKPEPLYTGTKAAEIVGLDPGIITAWVLRKIIKPATVEILTERKKIFKYDFDNLVELAILKHLSENLRIRLDIFKFLPKLFFRKEELMVHSLLNKKCYILILVNENKHYDEKSVEPQKPNEKRIKPYTLDVKVLASLDGITNDIDKSTSALLINFANIIFKLMEKI